MYWKIHKTWEILHGHRFRAGIIESHLSVKYALERYIIRYKLPFFTVVNWGNNPFKNDHRCIKTWKIPLCYCTSKKKCISKASTLKVAEIKIEVYHFSIHLNNKFIQNACQLFKKAWKTSKRTIKSHILDVWNNREKTILKIKFVSNGRFICSPSFIMADPLQKSLI